MKRKVLIIVGPTAVGKTRLSLALAERLANAEIVSADSRQIYKYMDIGTAKPTPEELAQIKHHFIDIKLPDEYYSAGKFGREARQTIERIFDQGKFPIVVGGSGLYLRALIDGFFEREIADEQVKNRLKAEIQAKGTEPFYRRLKQVDPESAEKIHPNDAHRIVRALEVYEISGQPLSKFTKQSAEKANFEPVFFGLTRNRALLYHIIEKRVDLMIAQGLVEEVQRLKEMGYHQHLNSMQTVGYREVFEYFEGKLKFAEMVSLIKQRTRNYAKRQLTWFRKDKRITWIHLDQSEQGERLLKNIIDELKH